MEKIKIKSLLREKSGKEAAKIDRRKGFIPAIIYGKDFNLSVNVPFDSKKILNSINFSESTIIEMEIEGYKQSDNSIPVLIKDVQYHPLSDDVIHLDFVKISLTEKIKVPVPVALQGECKGVKDGGILEQMLWHITIEALPTDIPENIKVDVSSLDIADSVHVRDLQLPDNIRVLESPSETVVTVVAKQEEVPEEAPLEEAREPEVIKEKEKEKGKEEKEES
ncbi:MAG: 50S ribosomal protein L25 [Candidatus Omnitrophota bacterium]